jgi:uncharacterized membrane protein HdeD (DUF308 family)
MRTCAGGALAGAPWKGVIMQDFSQKLGWTRGGLYLCAILLAVLGILCFVAPGIMPEPMHNTGLPDGLTPGGIFGGIVMLILGIVLIAAWKNEGGSRNMSGFMITTGIFSVFLALAVFLDPVFGTLSYEWVIAVFVGLWGFLAFLEALAGGRVIGYKGWVLQMLLGLVMICTAVGVLLDSSQAATMAGIGIIAAALSILIIPSMGKSIKLA